MILYDMDTNVYYYERIPKLSKLLVGGSLIQESLYLEFDADCDDCWNAL